MSQRAPGHLHLVERFRLLGVVIDRVDGGSGENQVSLHVGERVLDEAAHHTDRVLDVIPAAGVHDQLIETEPRGRAGAHYVTSVAHALGRAVVATTERR